MTKKKVKPVEELADTQVEKEASHPVKPASAQEDPRWYTGGKSCRAWLVEKYAR